MIIIELKILITNIDIFLMKTYILMDRIHNINKLKHLSKNLFQWMVEIKKFKKKTLNLLKVLSLIKLFPINGRGEFLGLSAWKGHLQTFQFNYYY